MTEHNTPPAHLMPGTIWRHKKRGTTYTILLFSTMQIGVPSLDGVLMVTYMCNETKVHYTRVYDEFMDGRFERVS